MTYYQESKDASVWTVAQLNRRVSQLLDEHMPVVWVKGEISNFTQAASGHWYFSIKDDKAAVRAVMFRGRAQSVGFVPRAGERFEFRCSVTLYEPRGDFQVQVEGMRRAGQGDLHEAFLRLKNQLQAEGLFDPQRRRPIAPLPACVGVITSLAAAALRDVLTAMARRAPHVRVVIYPAPVQGADAPVRLCQALETAIARAEVDTLLLVRGGGSLEDLWSFNDEALARAVAASPIPVISGVGHETDFTMVDFVADLRAPTPTAAAELACQARADLLDQLGARMGAIRHGMQRHLERASLRLDRAVAMLVSPGQRIAQQQQRLDGLTHRLQRLAGTVPERSQQRLETLVFRLQRNLPQVQPHRQSVDALLRRLQQAGGQGLVLRRQRLQAAQQTLQALSPRLIVNRGYAIVRNAQGQVVQNALDLNIGERLDVELRRGSVSVDVVRAHDLL
ncbi:exodeoxyribonuclease VII large subunit [Alcaligenes sp. SDU_A2]|uniref:exodeoxyribonuclease VII large subunit n=1 Tax=Alcaligenes sp. SDU_A2 TaxID=3136634 RepID=UPI00311FF8D0